MEERDRLNQYLDPSRALLGFFGKNARAEVATFLLSNATDSFLISEIAEGAGLSREAAQAAVKALVAWGQAEVAPVPGRRRRYRADQRSPVTQALELLTAALAQRMDPSYDAFRSALSDAADRAFAGRGESFVGSYHTVEVTLAGAPSRPVGKVEVDDAAGGLIAAQEV